MIWKNLGFCILVSFAIVLPVLALDIPFNETVAGERNLGQNFTWHIENVSGWSDVVYHYVVYDYRVLGMNYTYYSPVWGKWFRQNAGPRKQYLAVWVRGWLDGTSWYGYDQDRFAVWIRGNITIKPELVQMQDLAIGKLGSERHLPVVIKELENRTALIGRGLLTTERYGWKDDIQYDRMEVGISNAFDGYILYQIPEWVKPEDIRIAGWFGYWGTPVWYLTNRTINQASIERQLITEKQLMESQRAIGLRISDRPDRQIQQRPKG